LIEEEKNWLRDQLRAGRSFTILSAMWLGRLSPEETVKRRDKRRRDRLAVSLILAGVAPVAIEAMTETAAEDEADHEQRKDADGRSE
jgi:hypothetical protein